MKLRALHTWLLRAMAAFVLVWSAWRAIHQTVTLDEADTYFWFAGRELRFVWEGFPNNHLLNTLLIHVSTQAFGLSPLALRLPALLGAALYVAIAYYLSRSLSERLVLQSAAFLCLVANPFLLDYFAAARGYSLANAFLLAALAVPIWHTRTGRKSVAAAAGMASAAIGLSFASNFSYAFVDFAVLAVVAVWAVRERGPDSPLRVTAYCALPALAIVFVLCGYPLLHYPRRELWYGARSLRETAQSLMDDSFYRLPGGLQKLEAVRTAESCLLIALAVLCGLQLIAVMRSREARRSPRAQMLAAVAGIILFTIAAHYTAYRVAHLPLPESRTAIFFLPLATLFIALCAKPGGKSRISRWLGHATAALLLCLAAHYLLSLRSTYFKEYEWDADLQDIYGVITRLNRTYGVGDFTADGLYRSPLNFYRAELHEGGFPELPAYSTGTLPPGKFVYILHENYYRSFIEGQKLTVVYRGRQTPIAVAVAPGGPIPPRPVTP